MANAPSAVILGASRDEATILQRTIGDLIEVRAIADDAAHAATVVREHEATVAVLYMDHNPEGTLKGSREASSVDGCSTVIVSRDRDPEAILRAMRSGAKDFAYLDETGEDLRRAIKNLVDTSVAQRGKRAKTVAVFGCKGGSGATAIATNLAGALYMDDAIRAKNGKVALLDLDFHLGDCLIFLDMVSRYSWRDLIDNLYRLDGELLEQSLSTHSCGVQVVAQTGQPEEADELTAAGVREAIRKMKQHYDFIVIDGIRDFGEMSLMALDSADTILLTLTQDIPALKNANRCLGLFRRLGYGPDKVKLVLNRYTKRKDLDVDSIADALGAPVTVTVPNDFPTVVGAIDNGKLLLQSAPRAKVTEGIRNIVPVVRGEVAPEKRGIFGLWRRS